MMDRSAWDSAVARWKAAVLIKQAADEFGAGHDEEGQHMINLFILNERYGREESAREGSEALAAYKDDGARHQKVMDAYWKKYFDPAREAAQALVHVPAPDFDALQFKINLIRDEELYCYTGMENAFAIVERDAKRLAA